MTKLGERVPEGVRVLEEDQVRVCKGRQTEGRQEGTQASTTGQVRSGGKGHKVCVGIRAMKVRGRVRVGQARVKRLG